MSEVKVREAFNGGFVATDLEGNEWAFASDNAEGLVDWVIQEFGLTLCVVDPQNRPEPPTPQETSDETMVGGEALRLDYINAYLAKANGSTQK